MKTIKRTIIIRESDLDGLMYKTIKHKLYDRISYESLTYKEIQQENLVSQLKNELVPKYQNLPNIYNEMLWREKNLYNRRYLEWDLTMDYPDGQIWVQSRTSQPRERLLVATFEKDLIVHS